MARLSPAQLSAYLSESGYILYLRDRAQLNYAFSKLGKEGWKALATPNHEPPDPYAAPARAAFLAEYDLPEYRKPRTPGRVKAALRWAVDRRLLPNWALNLLNADEQDALMGKEGET